MPDTIVIKTCSKCKVPKPLSEFAPRKNTACGYQYHCRECQRLYRRTANGRANGRRYRASEKGKIAQRKERRKYPERKKARSAINSALRRGDIPRATTMTCHYCPEQATQYHHWHGYAKEHWLDVVPVCRTCDIHSHRAVSTG